MISLKINLIIVILIFSIFYEVVCHKDFVVVTRTKIVILNGKDHTTIDVGLNSMNFAAYDSLKNNIYVSDQDKKSIFRVQPNKYMACNTTELIVEKQTENVLGMTFNYLNSTLYWTTKGFIFYVRVPDKIMAPLEGKAVLSCSTIPMSIAIDVHRRYLYWANFANGTNAVTIERLNLVNFNRQVLWQDEMDPGDITLDLVGGNTLYWINWSRKSGRSIVSMDLRNNSTQLTLIYAIKKRKPSVIALDHQNVYWIDWLQRKFMKKPKNSSRLNAWPSLVSSIDFEHWPIGLFVLSGGDAEKSTRESVKTKTANPFFNK